MSIVIPAESASYNVAELLKQLYLGETVTLVDSDGTPLAILISLKPAPSPLTSAQWRERWEALAQKVERAWKTKQSAVEVLAEMRR